MKNYYVRKILNEDDLKIIKNVIDESNQNNCWIDGLNSFPIGNKSIKNNLELSNPSLCQVIHNLIMKSLDDDTGFSDFAVPKSSYLNIISKTSPGGFYNSHLDHWSLGDFSTTVFLNNPDEYSGGELCLYYGGNEEVKIKLDAGWGVTYSTGVLHRVNEVTKGIRYASIFWTESLIKDSFIRHIYNEIGNIVENMQDYKCSSDLSNCISAMKNPHFSLDNLRSQILRQYSSK